MSPNYAKVREYTGVVLAGSSECRPDEPHPTSCGSDPNAPASDRIRVVPAAEILTTAAKWSRACHFDTNTWQRVA